MPIPLPIPSLIFRQASKNNLSIKIPGSLCLILLFLFSSFLPANAAPKDPADTTILILPFTNGAGPLYDYLEDGLASVLASRLITRAEVTVSHQNTEARQLIDNLKNGQHEAFRSIMEKVKSDYLIIGSLSAEQNTFIITALMFSRNQEFHPQTFSRSLSDINKTLAAMDEIAWDIAAGVFGRDRPDISVGENEALEGITAFQTAHPERAYKEGLYRGKGQGLADGDLYTMENAHRSQKIPLALKDMNLADLDGDGRDEILLVANNELMIYRYEDDHFNSITSIPLQNYLSVHAVTMADINSNGVQEIYISANNRDKPASSVFEWDGRRMTTLHRDIPFYLRPGRAAKGNSVLLGQGGSVTGLTGQTISILAETTGGYIASEALNLPAGLNLFDFTQADITGNGAMEIIAIDRENHLLVMDRTGTVLWRSIEQYGASKNYLGTRSSTAGENRDRLYVPSRIVARDMDGDGTLDLLVGRNRLTTVKFLSHLRYFEGSTIAALSWQDNGLHTLWETRELPGYTVGYQLGNPAGGNGEPGPQTLRLFFAEGTSTVPFVFWESESCAIHYFEINRPVK